jgi:folate-dependent phosphoribosylglycinamide formyltransferase PurN
MHQAADTVRIGILGSLDNGPADYYLANQLIGRFDVPLILLQKPRTRSLRKKLSKLLAAGPAGVLEWWRNRQFEAQRRRELSEDLAARFAAAGSASAYESGPALVEVDDVHADASMDLLREAGVNVLFQNGAGILRAPLTAAYPKRILNVHHGWLPAIRGCHSIAWGLLENRADWFGVTVHLIDEGIDTGPILARERIAVGPGDTYASLFCAATVAGARLLVEAVADVAAGRCTPIPRTEPGEYRPAMTRRGWLALSRGAGVGGHASLTEPGKPDRSRPENGVFRYVSSCEPWSME